MLRKKIGCFGSTPHGAGAPLGVALILVDSGKDLRGGLDTRAAVAKNPATPKGAVRRFGADPEHQGSSPEHPYYPFVLDA